MGEMEDKLVSMEQEIKMLKREVQVLKRALRNTIARYEVSQIRSGREVQSIID
ncbi:MAG: hypothetical protein ACE5JV_00560 [Nitrososphaerales archaeon]